MNAYAWGMNKPKSRQQLLVSTASEDGSIIETVFDPLVQSGSFIRKGTAGFERLATIQNGDMSFVPIRATNDLVKHKALLFPSDIGEHSSTSKLLQSIDAYISRYVALSEEARMLACSYILLTWLYDAFRELPYLRFRGDYGTGKSRALIVIGSIAYKPFFASGASTVSPIFHTLDTFKGTLIFDEADFRFSDEKAELSKILNNGNAAGFPVLRTQVTVQKEFEPRAFHVFGPKIIGMRGSYEDRALESRFLTIDMEPKRVEGVPINLPVSHDLEALQLRNRLLTFRFFERPTASVDESLGSPNLEPRINQILIPLLSVVPEGPYRAAIERYARRAQERTISDRGDSVEGQMLVVMNDLSAAEKRTLSIAEISDAFRTKHASDYDRPITNRYVGSVIRRLGLQPYKSHGVYMLQAADNLRLEMLYKRYGVSVADRGR